MLHLRSMCCWKKRGKTFTSGRSSWTNVAIARLQRVPPSEWNIPIDMQHIGIMMEANANCIKLSNAKFRAGNHREGPLCETSFGRAEAESPLCHHTHTMHCCHYYASSSMNQGFAGSNNIIFDRHRPSSNIMKMLRIAAPLVAAALQGVPCQSYKLFTRRWGPGPNLWGNKH